MSVFPALSQNVLFVLIITALQFNLWAEEPEPMRVTSMFSFERGEADLSALHVDNPDRWHQAPDALIYKHDGWGYSMATLDAGVNDYRIDAEVNIGRADQDNPDLVNPGAFNSVGVVFRREGNKAAAFYLGRPVGGSLATLRFLPYLGSPFAGKDAVYGTSVDTQQDWHQLTILVKGDLVNAYVGGELACIGDLSDRPAGEVGLVSSLFGEFRSFSVSPLDPAAKLETERPVRSLLNNGEVYQSLHSWRDAVQKSVGVVDQAIEVGTEGVPGMEAMPAYVYRCVLWMKDGLRPFYAYPAFHHALLIDALLAYSDHSGDTRYRDEAIRLGDWTLDHLTPADTKLPHCAYSTTYNGEMAGNVDGESIMLDKVGVMGEALLTLWKRTKNDAYKEAAVKMGETLLKAQLPEGRWQGRVEYQTGKIIQDYVSNQVFNIRFMDFLYEETGDARYATASRKALEWTLSNPVKTWRWTGYYEDVAPGEESVGNYDAIDTALYLLERREQHPEYETIAVDIADWIATSFAVNVKGRWPMICEQSVCMPALAGHNFHYAVLLHALYEATGQNRLLDATRSTVNAGVDSIVSWEDPAIDWYSIHALTIQCLLDLGPKLDQVAQRKQVAAQCGDAGLDNEPEAFPTRSPNNAPSRVPDEDRTQK